MKRTIFLVLALASSLAAGAQTTPPPAVKQQKAASAAGPQAKPNTAEFDKQMARVEENVKMMQEQMEKLRQTRDPGERQRLLQQHWATMQGAMATMHGMAGIDTMCCAEGQGLRPGPGGHMMGGSMMGGSMGGMMGPRGAEQYYSGLTPEQLRQQQYMTDRYVAMQQQMMNHMMWHQHWLSDPSPSARKQDAPRPSEPRR